MTENEKTIETPIREQQRKQTAQSVALLPNDLTPAQQRAYITNYKIAEEHTCKMSCAEINIAIETTLTYGRENTAIGHLTPLAAIRASGYLDGLQQALKAKKWST